MVKEILIGVLGVSTAGLAFYSFAETKKYNNLKKDYSKVADFANSLSENDKITDIITSDDDKEVRIYVSKSLDTVNGTGNPKANV